MVPPVITLSAVHLLPEMSPWGTKFAARGQSPGLVLSGTSSRREEAGGVPSAGPQPRILQLNTEGLTPSKLDVIEHLANTTKALVVLLQETHCISADKLVLPNFALAGSTLSRKHGLATFVHQRLSWTLADQSPAESEIEWLCVDVAGYKIVNVYKPPPSRITPVHLPVFPHPCLYAGDFNCQHEDWGYSSNTSDGENLAVWAANNSLALLYDPKGAASFHSGRWKTGTNPDLAFASVGVDNRLPDRRVLGKFPRSQHRPSLITMPKLVDLVPSEPVKRWNFRKANWKHYCLFTNKSTRHLPSPYTNNVDEAYQDFCGLLVKAAKKSIPRGRRNSYKPCWDVECEKLHCAFLRAPAGAESDRLASVLLSRLSRKRQERWEEAINSIDFSHSSRKAWSILNNLTGRSRHSPRHCPISANKIASQFVKSGTYEGKDRDSTRLVAKEVSDLWKAPTPSGDNISGEFTPEEFATALQHLKPGKAPGPDSICPELILHAAPALKSWLRAFLSSCLRQLKIPKIWRRALVVAIPKPNKPEGDPKSYRPISLLCIPFKILERLIYARVEPIIDPLLPKEQAGFRRGRSTVDQVTLMTQDIEDCFSAKKKAGAVFIDLTAAYDTVWHRGLTCKLLRLLPDRHMVSMIMELVRNRSFTLTTGSGQQSRLRRLKNGVPQGSVLAPLLYNIYTYDLPNTVSRKYAYADDLALVYSAGDWQSLEGTLSQDMQTLAAYLRKWRLKLSEAKTVSAAFHLNNREAKRELRININGTPLPCCAEPTYLGVTLDRSLTFRRHLESLRKKLTARVALMRQLVRSDWGAGARTLRTAALALVYSTSEYCAPAWCRSSHTCLIDPPINEALRIVTGCLRPTPVDNLPILAGIQPAELRRAGATARLACRAVEPNHLLHDRLAATAEPPRRLKSRHPFVPAARDLLQKCRDLNISAAGWADYVWRTEWEANTSRLRSLVPVAGPSPPGMDLPRLAWTRLNRLRTGVGRFRSSMHRWGLASCAACECGAEEQTADHVILDCPMYRAPNGMHGLSVLDDKTMAWLLEVCPEV